MTPPKQFMLEMLVAGLLMWSMVAFMHHNNMILSQTTVYKVITK